MRRKHENITDKCILRLQSEGRGAGAKHHEVEEQIAVRSMEAIIRCQCGVLLLTSGREQG